MICGRCGEPTENPCLCGDCDVTYARLSSTCRECGFFICDPELVLVPRERQHSADCSLAKSESYGPRNTTELWSLYKETTR